MISPSLNNLPLGWVTLNLPPCSEMSKKQLIGASSQDGGVVDTLCLLAQPKEGQQQFKNKKQPELTENQTVWKSNN